MGGTGGPLVVGTVIGLVSGVLVCVFRLDVGQVEGDLWFVNLFRGFDDARLKCKVGPCGLDGLGRMGASSGASGIVAT